MPLFELKPALVTRWSYPTRITLGQLNSFAPLPNTAGFWRLLWNSSDWFGPAASAAITTLAWPWLTLISMLIFQQSLGHAKLNKVHLLRLAIYGCDFWC